MEMATTHGVLSRHDLREAGLPESYLAKLADQGALSQLAPGVYMDPSAEIDTWLEVAVVAKRVPHAVAFGVTALGLHDLTTQPSHAVEIAIARGRWTPTLDWPQLDVFHLSEPSFSIGIEERVIESYGLSVKVYSVAKTVADLFKFRSRFGLAVALEALREGWAHERFTLDELDTCARACRVHNVMRPYVEMLS